MGTVDSNAGNVDRKKSGAKLETVHDSPTRERHAEGAAAKCAYCSKSFKKAGKRKYCSDVCKMKRDNQTRLQKYHSDTPKDTRCDICGTHITIYGFWPCCSQKCIDRRTEIRARKKPCIRCGKPILKPRHYRYCSIDCRLEQYDRTRQNRLKLRVVVVGTCLECGEKITKKGQRTYCSRECMEKHNSYETLRMAENPPVKKCRKCGKAVGKGRVKYCSDLCQVLFHAKKDATRAILADRKERTLAAANAVE